MQRPGSLEHIKRMALTFKEIERAGGLTSDDSKECIYRAVREFTETVKMEKTKKPRVGILTIKESEKEAVLSVFGMTHENRERHSAYTYYVTDFEVRTARSYTLYVMKSLKEGQVPASNAATALIAQYKPHIVICCGIAGGVENEVNLGDVIVAEKVFYYEPGKVTPDGTLPNPDIFYPDAVLLDRCNNLPPWSAPKFDAVGEVELTKRSGVIATGEKIIANPDKIAELCRNADYKIIGFDKEGDGFSAAIWMSDVPVRGIVIRGVSDHAGLKKADPKWKEQKEVWQECAAKSAASFLLHFLYDDPLSEEL